MAAKMSSGAGISHFLPFPAHPAATGGITLHPRRITATIASAFFAVALAAWALTFAQQAFRGMTAGQTEGPVAFQPSQYLQVERTAGYLSR
ncbi:MAG: hypothetical protein PHI63_05320 [Patescibacteria group bacterium]|nr:hypothetical protein [Patescibacteria group bacterium]